MLRQSMQLGRMGIDGIRPPPHEVVIAAHTSHATPASIHRPQIAAQTTALVRPPLVSLFCCFTSRFEIASVSQYLFLLIFLLFMMTGH